MTTLLNVIPMSLTIRNPEGGGCHVNTEVDTLPTDLTHTYTHMALQTHTSERKLYVPSPMTKP